MSDLNCCSRLSLLAAITLLPLISITAGCGAAGPEFAPVRGVVTVDGKPMSQLSVRFMPDPDKGNDNSAVSSGETNDAGEYELKYYYKRQEGLGAAIGWHRVVIEDMRFSAVPQGGKLPPTIVPANYGSPAMTPLRIEVVPGDQEAPLEITSLRGRR